MMIDMEEGESIVFDYHPQRGTKIPIRGEVAGLIEGKPFTDALLLCWIGLEPSDKVFKNRLLGLEE